MDCWRRDGIRNAELSIEKGMRERERLQREKERLQRGTEIAEREMGAKTNSVTNLQKINKSKIGMRA